ncbi:MAG TPA: hypothetical protein VLJ41_08175 [Segetibacter sp.]|nr:hypothetical protein [Segetibacter sp.]
MRIPKPVLLVTLFFASFGIIALLAFLSKNALDKKNGFNRRLHTSVLKPEKQITFPVPVNKMIGSRNGQLYFQGNSPYEVYITDLHGDSITRKSLAIPPDKKLLSGSQMYMNGRHLYIANRNVPAVITYDLDSGNSNSHVFNQYYSKDALLSDGQFILRTIDPHEEDPKFIKVDLKNRYPRAEDHFSEKNGKGNFPTDGILYYDATTHLACYTYFYQNGFICMDTNLNLIVKARTIDTITKREIQTVHVGSSYTMKQPPPFVNYAGAVSAGKLYLQSKLKADNEFPLDFAENTIVDVYNLTNGTYRVSFYIPYLNGKNPSRFHVIDKKLYAVYGKNVVVYDLNPIEGL